MKCTGCGESLGDIPGTSGGERTRCPKCGSTARTLNVTASDSIAVSDDLRLTARSDEKVTGYRESERGGRAASADAEDSGGFSYSIRGTSPRGEEEALSACHILIAKLNALGANWLNPTTGEGVADCVSRDRDDDGNLLTIQVTRAIIDEEFWTELSRSGAVSRTLNAEELANHIHATIAKKASADGIARSVRDDLTLALDATRLPAVAFQDVVVLFRNRFGSWAQGLGFESIWLVGPTQDLTWKLDDVEGG